MAWMRLLKRHCVDCAQIWHRSIITVPRVDLFFSVMSQSSKPQKSGGLGHFRNFHSLPRFKSIHKNWYGSIPRCSFRERPCCWNSAIHQVVELSVLIAFGINGVNAIIRNVLDGMLLHLEYFWWYDLIYISEVRRGPAFISFIRD